MRLDYLVFNWDRNIAKVISWFELGMCPGKMSMKNWDTSFALLETGPRESPNPLEAAVFWTLFLQKYCHFLKEKTLFPLTKTRCYEISKHSTNSNCCLDLTLCCLIWRLKSQKMKDGKNQQTMGVLTQRHIGPCPSGLTCGHQLTQHKMARKKYSYNNLAKKWERISPGKQKTVPKLFLNDTFPIRQFDTKKHQNPVSGN